MMFRLGPSPTHPRNLLLGCLSPSFLRFLHPGSPVP
jgi:hypothetical protein